MFEGFIGNKRATGMMQLAIEGAKAEHRGLPHILFVGGAGLGKTMLARLTAEEMKTKFVDVVGGDLKNADAIRKCVLKTGINGIWFIDEIHLVPRGVQEIMLPLIEEFRMPYHQRLVRVPNFTVIGATTDPDKLVKPYQDRFQYRVRLHDYTEEEIKNIIMLHLDYVDISRTAIDMLASICRNTARYAVSYGKFLVRDYWLSCYKPKMITSADVKRIMEIHGIYPRGLTEADINYLTLLRFGTQGYETMKAKFGYELIDEVERYMLRIGFIEKSRLGRKITKQGLNYLNGLVA